VIEILPLLKLIILLAISAQKILVVKVFELAKTGACFMDPKFAFIALYAGEVWVIGFFTDTNFFTT
jgi:hypothetical protein